MEPSFEETWPVANTLASECLVNLAFLAGRMGVLAESLARSYGFSSLAASDALARIDRAGGPLSASVIAEQMLVTRPTITGVIRSLARAGLVKRMAHPSDRRMALLDATPKGKKWVRKVRLLLPRGSGGGWPI
jgi:DNA-binding MarR family transcriptional regulator